MRKRIFSLQFRLILGFAIVLALALGAVSVYVGNAAEKETRRFQEEVNRARMARLHWLVSRTYATSGTTVSLEPAIRQASALYGWRIVVTNLQGQVIEDTHSQWGMPVKAFSIQKPAFVLGNGPNPAYYVQVDPNPELTTQVAPEPPASRIVRAVNSSLMWTGLAVGMGGIVLVSFVSRRILSPIRVLNSAARQLGQGDLSQRVPINGWDEVGELALTFNTMAEGLERAERQRRSLMADVAHELRTPLSNIRGYLEAVRDGLLQPDQATIDTIYQQVLYLTHLVEDLRILALADAGALRLYMEPDSLEEVLHRSVEAMRPRAEARGISLSLQIAQAIPLVRMDRTRIAQVVANLLENALAHTPKDGSVSVLTEMVGDRARVTVADTSEGIPPEHVPFIFDRFYRIDPSRSRATGGAGLGLTIAKKLVEAHQGSIWVESTPGQGSRFTFELPLAGPGSNPDEREQEP